jgi:peptidoglycan-N-acetylglucosamine deacetylase
MGRCLCVRLLLLSVLLLLLCPAALSQSVFRSFPSSDPKYLALTFDDGPHRVLTTRLLDLLKQLKQEKNITAHVTFFVMGVKAQLHPDILRRAIVEGHEVANHVWNHPVLTQIPWEDLQSQIHYTSRAIYNATQTWPKVMRPPYGKTSNPLNNRIFRDLHMPVILWSLDTLDWMRPGAAEIERKAVSGVKAGTILLCHDIHPGTVEAIPRIVTTLSSQGYEFRTVSDLLQRFHPKALAVSSAPPSDYIYD